jgi:hypothetical protein
MKRSKIAILGMGLAAALLAAACTYTPFQPVSPLGADAAAQTAAINAQNAVILSDDDAGITGVTITGAGLTADADQIISVLFTGGNVDQATVEAAVKIGYISSSRTTADYLSTFTNTAITPTKVVLAQGNDQTTAYITLNLAVAGITPYLEVAIDPAAFSGSLKLDIDQDGIFNESPDDVVVSYLGAIGNGASVNTTAISGYGETRSPQELLNNASTSVWTAPAGLLQTSLATGVTNYPTTVGFNPTEIYITNITATNGRSDVGITAASLCAGITVAKFNPSTLAWDNVTYTSALLTANTTSGTAYTATTASGTLVLTLPAAATVGSVYRITYDKSKISESVAVGGYTHKAANSKQAVGDYLVHYYIKAQDANNGTSARSLSSAAAITKTAAAGKVGSFSTEVTTDAAKIVASTLTSANVKVYLKNGSTYSPVANYTLVKTASNKFLVQVDGVKIPAAPITLVVAAYGGLKDEGTVTTGTTAANDDTVFGGFGVGAAASATGNPAMLDGASVTTVNF